MRKPNVKILLSVVLAATLLVSTISNNYFSTLAFQNEENNTEEQQQEFQSENNDINSENTETEQSVNNIENITEDENNNTKFSLSRAAAYSTSVDVDSFESFRSALLNPSVTEINVVKSIKFTKNIFEGIPNRDVTVNGNADRGIVIDSNMFSIYGKQNKSGMNTFSIINANITGRGTPRRDDFTDGRFFTGGQENGPNAYGWDVYAKDVKYVGARFVHLSNGTLTFDGNCEIYTNCENAWVNHVVFKSGSTYISSNSGTGDYGAFYFNKGKGIADGTATIEAGAKTYFNLGTALQPVFTGDVYKTTVGENAVFDVNCLGHAIWYVAGSSVYYKLGAPTFDVESGAIVDIREVDYTDILNAKNGKINPNPNFYTPVYYAKSGEPELAGSLNIMPGASFYLSGSTYKNSTVGLIRGGNGFNFNMNQPKDYDIKNLAVNANVITANYGTHRINMNINSDVKSWLKTNVYGYYDDNAPYKVYDNVIGNVTVKGNSSESVNANNTDFRNTFLMQKIGRIALKGGITKQYNVLFDSMGGTEVPSQKVNEGEKALEPNNPTKTGHIFLGWYIDANGTTPWDFNTSITSDITLYAKWEVSDVTVYFYANGGTPTNIPTQTVKINDFVQEPTGVTKDGYRLVGWSISNNINDLWDFSNNPVTKSMTLYAIWEKNPTGKLIVSFNTNGGTPTDIPTQTVKLNGYVRQPAAVIKNGYKLVGWSPSNNASDLWDFSNYTVTRSMTLHAIWEKAPVCDFTVSFNTNGGTPTDIPTQTLQINSLVEKPKGVTKKGYRLVGWSPSNSADDLWNFQNGRVYKSMTLHAIWEKVQAGTYKVTFYTNGGTPRTIPSQTIERNGFVQEPAGVTKKGYRLVGWSASNSADDLWDFSSSTVSKNIRLYAIWEK